MNFEPIWLALDFDGVLNSNQYIWDRPDIDKIDDPFLHIDPSRVAIMNRLVDKLQCFVVISSAWRILHSVASLKTGLAGKGATFTDRIMGKTDSSGRFRGGQIQRWMDGFSDHKLVILDDSIDMEHLLPLLVRTNPDTGMVDEDIERAIKVNESPQ